MVEAAYTLLRSKLVTVRDFVSLQRAHQEFLATLRAKFYVDNLAIAQVPVLGSFYACVLGAHGGKSAKPGQKCQTWSYGTRQTIKEMCG